MTLQVPPMMACFSFSMDLSPEPPSDHVVYLLAAQSICPTVQQARHLVSSNAGTLPHIGQEAGLGLDIVLEDARNACDLHLSL